MAGDIVSVSRRTGRWVVVEFVGAPAAEPRLARVIRSSGEVATAFLTSAANLTLVESPAFAPGERVKVDGRPGAITEDGDPVRVLLDASTHEISRGDRLALPAAECTPPRWRLVMENKL